MIKENTVVLKLSNKEIQKLVALLYKGCAYDGCFLSKVVGKNDWELVSSFQQKLVDGSNKYKDKNIKVRAFNGALTNELTGELLFKD